MAKRAKATLEVENLDAVADRGYFDSEEILACEEAGITVTLPKPMTSGINVRGRFGKQDFRYVAEQDVYICPAGERLAYHYTNEEHGLVLRRYWTNACRVAPSNTAAPPARSAGSPDGSTSMFSKRCSAGSTSIRRRCASGGAVEHPFGTIKARMGATDFLMKTLPKVATEMALHVLAYNLTRVMNIMGIQPLVAVMRA